MLRLGAVVESSPSEVESTVTQENPLVVAQTPCQPPQLGFLGTARAQVFQTLCSCPFQVCCMIVPSVAAGVLLMKMLVILLGLLIVGLLVVRQLDSAPQGGVSTGSTGAPVVPTSPEKLSDFGQETEEFMQDAAERRRQQMDEQMR